MAPFPHNRKYQRDHGHGEEENDEVALEPVLGLPAIQNNLQARKSHGHRKNSPSINLQPSGLARRLDLTRELRRIRQQAAGQEQRNDADGNVDEEYPSPAPMTRNPAAQWRSD